LMYLSGGCGFVAPFAELFDIIAADSKALETLS
jgi:hypothetical protein